MKIIITALLCLLCTDLYATQKVTNNCYELDVSGNKVNKYLPLITFSYDALLSKDEVIESLLEIKLLSGNIHGGGYVSYKLDSLERSDTSITWIGFNKYNSSALTVNYNYEHDKYSLGRNNKKLLCEKQ